MSINSLDSLVVPLKDGMFLIRERKSRGCNVFVLKGTHKNLLIDIGLPDDYEILSKSLAEIGLTFNDIHMVVLTHEHLDHVGCLPFLPAHTIVAAHGRAASKLSLDDQFSMMTGAFNQSEQISSHIDIHLEDGALIDLGGKRLRVIYTPGHCSGSICLLELNSGALFAGDTIFANGILGGIFASGNISDYINSLERLKEFRITSLYPGHGRMSENPASDIERAINGSSLLMSDTQSLFGCINIHSSFEQIMSATKGYSRQAAERRASSRAPCDIEALVHFPDADHPVKVRNISISGAQLDRALPLDIGETISITIKDIGNLECKVISLSHGLTHFTFLHSPDVTTSLETWLIKTQQNKAKNH